MGVFFVANMLKIAILGLITKDINMRKNKKQYAKPIKVSDIKNYCNPEKGYAGYNIEVIFKDNTNIPYPNYVGDYHCITDLNGTSTVVYFFPFVGYGIINWGKLAAKHWANKMRRQINPGDLEPLYELSDEKNMEFVCRETNQKCDVATTHFQNFKKFIDDCAESKSPRTISTQEINCCVGKNCPVWQNYIAKLKQKIK